MKTTQTYGTSTTISISGVPLVNANVVISAPMSKNHVADASIVKIDEDKRQVFGWASIIKDESGKILLDRQDDFIDSEDELEKAAYDYVLRSRDGGEMHVRRGVSKMIESVVFTEEKQSAMGIPAGVIPTGWWIGFQVNDNRVWEQVKKGDYAGFSVHGTGKRESTELPIEKVTEIGKSAKGKKKTKIATVMGEFKAGKLKSSSGEKVTDPKQAMAIAISEQKRAKMKKISLADVTKKSEELSKREFSTKQRQTMAEEGEAMPDGSFPIKSRQDVQNALQSIGRAKNRDAVLRHIRRRCKDLGCEDMLPDWAVSKATEDLVRALSVLLADTVSVYHEAHGFHWNVKGQDFSQYHALFESIYSDLYGSIDPIAENILKLGMDAPFQLSQFIGLRTISESQPANDPQSMATELLDCINQLIDTLNMAFDTATAENQQGIANFIAERIDATQKWAWQLRSSVGIQKGESVGHPFRGNQHTGAKGGGRLPSGGTKQSLERAKVKQLARAQKFREKTSASSSKLSEKNPDGTKKYAKRSEAGEAMTSPNTPKEVKQRLASAKPLDGGGKRVYSNTIFGGRGKDAEGSDIHIFADKVGGKPSYRVEVHVGGGKTGKILDQKPYGAESSSPTFRSLEEAKAHVGGFGSGGPGRYGLQTSRANEPVDWYGIQ